MESTDCKMKSPKHNEKSLGSMGDTDSYNPQSDLQMLLSQLEEFNQAITVLAAEKADLSIQLELARSNLSNADKMLEKMKSDHSSSLQEKSKLLEEIDQLVDVINQERLRFKESNEQNGKEREENMKSLKNKDLEIETSKTNIAEKMKCIEQLNMRTETYLIQIEEIRSFSEELRSEYCSKDQRDSLIIQEKENEISELKKEIIQLKATEAILNQRKELSDSTAFNDSPNRETGISTISELPYRIDEQQLKSEEYREKFNQMYLEKEKADNALKQMMQTNKKQQDTINSLQNKLKEKDQHLYKYIKSKQDWEETICKLRTEITSLHSQLNELANSDTRKKLETELAMLMKRVCISEKRLQESLFEKEGIQEKNSKLKKALLQLNEENSKKDLRIKKHKLNCKKQNSEINVLFRQVREYESVLQAKSKEVTKLSQKQIYYQDQLNRTKTHESVDDSRFSDQANAIPREESREQEIPSQENVLLKEVNQLRDSYDEMQSLCKQLEHKLATERLEEENMKGNDEHLILKRLDEEFAFVKGEETHKMCQDKILNLEHELLQAKSSAETIEKLNESYKLDLESENKMRIHQGEEAQQLMKESRLIIDELSLRAREAEDKQNHSLRVISQLSQRLTRSIEDYKHLEEISMTRCQELALEANTHV